MKTSNIFKQTCDSQLQVCLGMYDLYVGTNIKGLILPLHNTHFQVQLDKR